MTHDEAIRQAHIESGTIFNHKGQIIRLFGLQFFQILAKLGHTSTVAHQCICSNSLCAQHLAHKLRTRKGISHVE
jgi:hypothetical protein